MTLRGNIQDFPLRSVLDLLAQTQKTGELQVRAGESVGALGIAGGRVVTAVFGEEEPLIALGAIFALDGAEFEFTPWDDAPPANLDAGTLDELLLKAEEAKKQAEEARRKAEEEREAARKKAEEEREAERQRIAALRALVPSDDLPFRLSERAVEQGAVTFTSERWRLVLAVNGERDLNAIASLLHMDNDAALTALADLVRDGVIETTATSAPPVHEAPAPDSAPAVPEPAPEFTSPAETESAAGVPAATQDWITPDQAAPAQDWTAADRPAPAQDWTSASEPDPISEVAPAWPTTPEPSAPAQDWIKPELAETPPAPETEPAMDDRLSALTGIFGPPTEPEMPTTDEPPQNSWAPPAGASEQWGTPAPPAPTSERWSAPSAPEPAAPSADPWGVPPSTAPAQASLTPPASAPPAESDDWVAPPPPSTQKTWSAPAAVPGGADPWGIPPGADPRTQALSIPEPGTPPVEEWSPPPAAPPEKKKRGLFGFAREKPAPAPVAGRPLPTAGVVGGRVGMVAALANALIAEYNGGQYGKGRIEERIAGLLMRVDEQADPIDRPLPIVDDRIDVEALGREQVADSQALPYLALLVTTIFADAEKTFGKDKAKKGYKAALKSVMLGDGSVLSSPELAGKLPRV